MVRKRFNVRLVDIVCLFLFLIGIIGTTTNNLTLSFLPQYVISLITYDNKAKRDIKPKKVETSSKPKTKEVKKDEVYLLIDGEYASTTCQELGLRIFYKELSEYFSQKNSSSKVYPKMYVSQEAQKYMGKLLDIVKGFGYEVVIQTTDSSNSDERIKTDLIELVVAGKCKQIILLTGDHSFEEALIKCHKYEVETTLCSFKHNTSKRLINTANFFIDIQSLEGICLKPKDKIRPIK